MTHSALIVNTLIIISSIGVFTLILLKSFQIRVVLSFRKKAKFAIIGIIAMFCDTIGVGSFATSMAMLEATHSLEDEKIPAYMNLMQVLPNGLEAVLFLTVIHVDMTTFIYLVVSSIAGGYISGRLVAYLPRQQIRIAMISGLVIVAILLILTQANVLPIGGNANGLSGTKLILGTICFFFIGGLPAIGVGGYALMQVLLFLMGMTPLAVFPIMTASGALQQAATTISFLGHKNPPLKEAAIAGIFGCIGVMTAFLLLKNFSTKALHWLLLMVVLYNVYMLAKAFIRDKNKPV